MTVEKTILLEQILQQVQKNERLLLELKGYLGFQEAKQEEPLTKAPDSYVELLNDYNATVYTGAGEPPIGVADAASKPYWERVGNIPCIRDLKVGDSPVKLTAWVESKEKVGEFTYPASHKSRAGQQGRVQNVVLSDGSGTIRLCLWNEQIDKFTFKTGAEIDLVAWKIGEHEGKRNIVMGPKGTIMPHMQEALE
jgi:hypothetical protein